MKYPQDFKKHAFLWLLLFALFPAIHSYGQELQVKDFQRLDRDLYARTHERLDLNETPCAVLRVSVADTKEFTFTGNIIGEVEYHPGEAIIYMTNRSRSINIMSDKFGLLKYEFPERLEKQVVYRLELKLVLPEDQKRKTLVMLEGGFHPSQTSFGAMVGIVAKHGAYLRFRSDFRSASTDLECDDTGVLTGGATGTPYYVEGSSKKARMSVTGGYLYRVAKPLYGYIGAGYGYRTLAWETVGGEWAKNTDHSASGIAAEIGAIGRYKSLAISLGCQSINFKYLEASVGIGFFF